MKELIKIKAYEGKNVVSARELHQLLQVKTRFNDWINYRLAEYQFRKDIDFTEISVKPIQTGRPQTDYALTVDTAKELAMIEKTEQGRFVRQYFIQCEKQLQEEKKADHKAMQLKARYCDIILTRIALNKEAASIRYKLFKLEKPRQVVYLPVFTQTELFTA
jgi:anti-repressor protein